MYIPCTITLLLFVSSLGMAQYPYVIKSTISLNNSEVIGMYSSPSLVRVVTQKDQVLTFQLIKGSWSLTGTRLLNSNAERMSFSANGDMIFYKAHFQLPDEVWWKAYWISCSCYFVYTTDKNVIDATVAKNQGWIAFTFKSGLIQIYSIKFTAPTVFYQGFDYPMINQYTQMNQNSLTSTYNNVTSGTILMNLPIYDKQIASTLFSEDATNFLVVYNRNFYCNVFRFRSGKWAFFQTLDHPTRKIYTPSISSNTSILILPTQNALYYYQMFGLESNAGQYILQASIPIDTKPKTFIATSDYKTLLVANQSDIVIYQHNSINYTYTKKWRGRFNATIDYVSMSEQNRIFVALNNKQGLLQLMPCSLTSKLCNESTLTVSSSVNPSFFSSIIENAQEQIQNNSMSTLIYGLVVINLIVLLAIVGLGIVKICIYKRMKRSNKVDVEKTQLPTSNITNIQITKEEELQEPIEQIQIEPNQERDQNAPEI